MKKHVSILLGLLVIFSSLFVSCDENELDSNICKITVKSEGNGTVSITDYIGTSVNMLIGNRVEVVATPDDGWAFIGWYIDGTESPISTDAAFTFTTSESVTSAPRISFTTIPVVTLADESTALPLASKTVQYLPQSKPASSAETVVPAGTLLKIPSLMV